MVFCDPRSPWRPDRTDTNGLLRQYFPKGESLAGVTQAELDEVARKLNAGPARRSASDPRRETSRADRRAPHGPPERYLASAYGLRRLPRGGMRRCATSGWCTDRLRPSRSASTLVMFASALPCAVCRGQDRRGPSCAVSYSPRAPQPARSRARVSAGEVSAMARMEVSAPLIASRRSVPRAARRA